MDGGFGHGFGGGIGMWLIWLIPLVIIIWALRAFSGRGPGDGSGSGGTSKTARDILDEEYARGRIDREEYLRRKRDLRDA
jgi:putative membrane protein